MSNLYMKAGNRKEFPITVTNPDDTPLNLTGKTLRWTARTSRFTDAVALSKVSTDAAQIEITDATAGEALLKIPPADTAVYEIDIRLKWDLQVATDADDPQIVDSGNLYISIPVTTTAP